jgi:hypothetical protein
MSPTSSSFEDGSFRRKKKSLRSFLNKIWHFIADNMNQIQTQNYIFISANFQKNKTKNKKSLPHAFHMSRNFDFHHQPIPMLPAFHLLSPH